MSDNDQYVYEWHVRYEYADGTVVQRPEVDARKGVRSILVAAGAFVALGAGAGAAVGLRIGAGKDKTVSVPSRGFSLAGRALLYGSLIAWVGTGALVLAVAKLTGVRSFREFGDKMRESVPSATEPMSAGVVRPLRRFLEGTVGSVIPKRDGSSKD